MIYPGSPIADMERLPAAAVTEITLRYYPASITKEKQERYQHALLHDMGTDARVSDDAGWAVEEVEREGMGMAKVLVCLAFEREEGRAIVGKSLGKAEEATQIEVFNVKLEKMN